MDRIAKKLIEAAMPVKEISAESVRDKSIRHGHISTLHLWWARRPLPVCRAVVFASLVPDPLDEHCPQVFREAVDRLLGKTLLGDPYRPYDDIPYTSAVDRMEDNRRNRLLMFIGKFSDEFVRNDKAGKVTPAGKLLSDFSLIKWDNKNNDAIITIARKLIWVAHNAATGHSLNDLLAEFDSCYKAITTAEKELYALPDRHLPSEEVQAQETALHNAIETFLNKMPRVFDPFAGGGAIPLEAARLGCRSYGNDINPVAHIIQKGGLEFPQKYGKPITYSTEEFIRLYGEEEFHRIPNEQRVFTNGDTTAVTIKNRLAFDVGFYAKKMLALAEQEVGHLYPADEHGKKPIAYYWARVGTCANPSCRAEVPLLKQFYMCNKPDKKVYLKPVITGTRIEFEIAEGKCTEEGWNYRGNLKCPCCSNITDVKQIKKQFLEQVKERLIATIYEGTSSKEYRLPTEKERQISNIIFEDVEVPQEQMQRNSAGGDTFTWGITRWGQMFSSRQLYTLFTLTTNLHQIQQLLEDSEYSKAILTYLGVFIDRIAAVNTSFSRWDVTRENIQSPFARQAIAITFDYPESNMFSGSTGSAHNQLEWILRYIESEKDSPFITTLQNASSGDKEQFDPKYLTAVVTDPPYYDAIAYADLSDFFYVWLKRTLGNVYPFNFATPQTPKSEECTALKHHHNDNKDEAKAHFEEKLLQIFDAMEHQTSDIVSIMFAHQSTEAWTTLCNSILGAHMNITGSWAIDTEMANRSVGLAGAALASSVTVSCRPAQRSGIGSYREVKKAIEATVAREVEELYALGFRGADLLTACFGQAVSEFGRYEHVEKADGTNVTVADLLDMARESAFNALLKGFDGDDFTKFYIGWLQLYGFAESDFDDAAKFSRVGLSIDVSDLFTAHILIKNGNKQTLGTYEQRYKADQKLGSRTGYLIDLVHRAMALYKTGNRPALLSHIGKVAPVPEHTFWRVLTSLHEILPAGSDDHKQAAGLLVNKESLIRESKTIKTPTVEQVELDFDTYTTERS